MRVTVKTLVGVGVRACLALFLSCIFGMSQTAKAVRVVIETELGNIEAETDTAHAPLTAANFLKYVNGGFYGGGRFHRRE